MYSFEKTGWNSRAYLNIFTPLRAAVCWWAWVEGDSEWKDHSNYSQTRLLIRTQKRKLMGKCWGNSECNLHIKHNPESVFSTGQTTNEPTLLQGMVTSWHSLGKHQSTHTLKSGNQGSNPEWRPTEEQYLATTVQSPFPNTMPRVFLGFLQSFMFQIHTFQSKCFSCHNNFINLFSDVLFNHIILKKLDGSGQCLNLFCSHLAHKEPRYCSFSLRSSNTWKQCQLFLSIARQRRCFSKNLFVCGLIIKFLKPRRHNAQESSLGSQSYRDGWYCRSDTAGPCAQSGHFISTYQLFILPNKFLIES